jgi:hypothetical protein
MIFPPIFAIVVGIGMIGIWSVSYFTNQIPELETEPMRIKFHLAAEFTTAIVLLAAGIGLLTGQNWALDTFLISMGMLLYTVIVSPGYFAQKGQWAYVVMFGVILVLALVSIFVIV